MAENDDDTLSDAELDILDQTKPGVLVMIDMNSAVEVERANRLLARGFIKTAGQHLEDDGPGVWTLIERIGPDEAVPPYDPLVAFSHVNPA